MPPGGLGENSQVQNGVSGDSLVAPEIYFFIDGNVPPTEQVPGTKRRRPIASTCSGKKVISRFVGHNCLSF